MNQNKRITGRICICLSTVTFGFLPVLTALSYKGGNNGINMAFLRAVLPIPVFLLLGIGKAMPTREQWKQGLLAGMLSFGCTLMLYSSYEYISPGLATMLHFLYPVYVSLYDAVHNRKWPELSKMLGLVMGLAGCLLSLDLSGTGGNFLGYLLAILSGVADAAYLIILGREAHKPMPLPRLMLTVSISGFFLTAAVGILTHKLVLNMNRVTWLYTVAVAMLSAVVGCVLFQKGVREIGECDAALFALFEPVTSMIFSVMFLSETISARKVVACTLILAGLVLISLQKKENNAASENGSVSQ